MGERVTSAIKIIVIAMSSSMELYGDLFYVCQSSYKLLFNQKIMISFKVEFLTLEIIKFDIESSGRFSGAFSKKGRLRDHMGLYMDHITRLTTQSG